MWRRELTISFPVLTSGIGFASFVVSTSDPETFWFSEVITPSIMDGSNLEVGAIPLILLTHATCSSSSLSNFPGKSKLSTTAHRDPLPHDVMLPANGVLRITRSHIDGAGAEMCHCGPRGEACSEADPRRQWTCVTRGG